MQKDGKMKTFKGLAINGPKAGELIEAEAKTIDVYISIETYKQLPKVEQPEIDKATYIQDYLSIGMPPSFVLPIWRLADRSQDDVILHIAQVGAMVEDPKYVGKEKGRPQEETGQLMR
jgi:hypothetical protein